MQNKITEHFHLRNSNARARIYLRLTVNGERSEFSTDIKIESARWNPRSEMVKGRSEDSKSINSTLHNLLSTVGKYRMKDEPVTVHQIVSDLKGVGESKMTLFKAYEYHVTEMNKLAGTVYATSTSIKYEYSFNSLKRYHPTDVKLSDLNIDFIDGYYTYMRVTEKLLHNSAAKNIKSLIRVINVAIRKKWLLENPFKDFSCAFINTPRHYLTEPEIEALYTKVLPIDRLRRVRDCFLFQVYTGLAFSDMQELTVRNIEIGVDGREWIVNNRIKNGNRFSIPVLPRAKEIIDRYREVSGDKLLPICTNQRFNGYLKEIADVCGITKNLTSHIGRHTFATTITLSKGIPIETVSRLLGHASLITTQIYAKVNDRKVSEDMNKLFM